MSFNVGQIAFEAARKFGDREALVFEGLSPSASSTI
jgi:hypothetical protein